MSKCFRFLTGAFLSLFVVAQTGTALADPQAFHFVDITEVYSNADGTRQYVEMISNSVGQNGLTPTWIISLNADGTDTNIVFDFIATYAPGFNTNQTILLMTQAMQDDLGLAADFTIPENSIFFPDGRVIFEDPPPFPQVVDAVAYGAFTGSNTGFGTPTAAMPGDDCRALRHNIRTSPKNNSIQWGVGNGTPRNHAGETVTLSCPPIAPILAPINDQATNEGQLLTFGASASDGNDDVIILTSPNRPSGANFVDHGNGTATFTWTPTFVQSGVYVDVQIIASDGGLADTELVTITVNEITNPPVASDASLDVQEDIQNDFQLTASDPDNDDLTYEITSGPFHGDVTNLDAGLGVGTYTNDLNYNGRDSIFFRVNDGNANSNTAVHVFVIQPVNDVPVGQNVQVGTIANTLLPVGPMPVIDVDDPTWTISHQAGPFHGVVTNFDAADGSFDYTPALDYVGADTIVYVADDGHAAAKSASTPGGADTVFIAIAAACVCDCHADPICDGNPDVLDVVQLVTVAFRNGTDTVDGACTHVGRSDTNCDCFVDVIDVVNMVNHAFRNDVTPFCDPCADPCP